MQKSKILLLSIHAKKPVLLIWRRHLCLSVNGCIKELLIQYKQKLFLRTNNQYITCYSSLHYHVLSGRFNCSQGVHILMQHIVQPFPFELKRLPITSFLTNCFPFQAMAVSMSIHGSEWSDVAGRKVITKFGPLSLWKTITLLAPATP